MSKKTIQITHLKIAARDGFQLAATIYSSDPANTVFVIINSATGVKRRFYDRFARFLAREGFIAVTYDYRGIGDSRPTTLNKFKAQMHQWGEEDFAGVIDWVVGQEPAAGIFLVAHSVGGQILGLAENNHRIARVVMVACQSGYWRLWPLHQRYFIFLFWYFFLPLSTALCSFFPAKWFRMGENLPAGVALEWASWGREPRYLLGRKTLTSRQNFERMTAPICSFSIDGDRFAPPLAVDELALFYPNATTIRRHLNSVKTDVPLGHSDFFRERFRDTLWRECVNWFHMDDK